MTFQSPLFCSFSLQYFLYLDFCNWTSDCYVYWVFYAKVWLLDKSLRKFQLRWLLRNLLQINFKSLHWLVFIKTSHNTLHCANSWDILKENWWRGKQDQHHFSRRLQLTKLFPQTWLLIFCLMGFWKLFNWRWFGKLFTHFQPLLETQTESRQNCILY